MLHQMVGSLSRTHGYTDTHLHVRAGRQQVGSLQIRRQLGSSHSLGLGYRVGLPGGCACLCSSLLLLCTGLPWQCTRWRQVCKGSLSSLGGLLGLRLGCGWGLEGITMLPPHCEHLSAAHSVSRIFCTGGTEWRDQTPTPGPGELVLLQSRKPSTLGAVRMASKAQYQMLQTPSRKGFEAILCCDRAAETQSRSMAAMQRKGFR